MTEPSPPPRRRAGRGDPRRGGARRGRQARGARARAARAAGRRPRPARGRARRGQDADRALVRRRDRACASAACSSRPTCCPPTSPGSSVFDQRAASFEFRPGPVFCNLLLGDEINRAPPKTQAALLEAMEERQVTADDGTHPLERPFLVLATQNPIEYEGTYPLPEAQLDRFLVRLRVGYPDGRRRVAHARRPRAPRDRRRRAAGGHRPRRAAAPAGGRRARPRRRGGRALHGRPRHRHARERGGRGRRQPPRLARAAAPGARAGRDGGARLRRPRRRQGRRRAALAHRLVLRPELWVRRVDAADVVRRVLDDVPAPPATEPQDDARERLTDAR